MEKGLSKIGIVGTGAMGRGIAQVTAAAGCTVQLFDAAEGAASRAIRFIHDDLMQAVAKGKLGQADADATLQRIVPVGEIAELAGCELVVEAIVESLEAKQQLLLTLEANVEPDCIIATNTSSLSVTAIAAVCKRPGRVAGWHFFNPVPRMRLVEVVQAPRTAPEIIQALVTLSRRVGHRAVVVPDSPGFVVNHAGRAFVTEGLKLLAERAAEHQVLDAILRNCAGFRMGPFELLDLTGLDVSVPVMESIHAQYYGDDRYRPAALARTRLLAGLLGRKNGQGFYDYADRNAATKPVPQPPAAPTDVSLWWPTEGPAVLPEPVAALLDKGKRVADARKASVVVVAPVGADLSSTVADLGLDPVKVIAVDPVFCGPAGVTLMRCPATSARTVEAARAIFAAQSIPTFVIADSPGYVAPRVVTSIVNLACEMAQQGIASPEDIDAAVRLGLGYPAGPFEWGERIGAQRVLDILNGLYDTFRDQRYRPSPWLVRRARLALPLNTPDQAD